MRRNTVRLLKYVVFVGIAFIILSTLIKSFLGNEKKPERFYQGVAPEAPRAMKEEELPIVQDAHPDGSELIDWHDHKKINAEKQRKGKISNSTTVTCNFVHLIVGDRFWGAGVSRHSQRRRRGTEARTLQSERIQRVCQ